MKELARLAWDVLLFKHEAYTRHIVRADALKRGLALLVLVSLVAGALSLAQSVINDLRPVSIETQRQEAEQGIREFLRSMREMEQFTQAPPEVAEQMAEYMRTGIEIGLDIEALPATLPRPLGRLLLDLGTFLSLPFSRIASWIGYTIWVLLVAKLLGGRATVPQSLGATALYVVPQILEVFAPVDCLGGMLGFLATVWSAAIYVKALAVANEFSIGRSVVATVVPAIVGGGLAFFGVLTFLILAAFGG